MTTKFSASRPFRKTPSWCKPGMYPIRDRRELEEQSPIPPYLNICLSIDSYGYVTGCPPFWSLTASLNPYTDTFQASQTNQAPTGLWTLAADVTYAAPTRTWQFTITVYLDGFLADVAAFSIVDHHNLPLAAHRIIIARTRPPATPPWLLNVLATI